MKTLAKTVIAGCGLSLVVAAFAQKAGDDAQQLFTKVLPSVVTVRVLDEQGEESSMGSGVVIGKELVATNCHVVRKATRLRVISQSGELVGQWVRQDPLRDICILAVAGLAAPQVSLRRSETLVVGEPVFAVGNPLGFGLAVSSGLVSVIDEREQPPQLIASVAMSPGSSGGGLFDRAGQLVGITTAILGTGQNLNLVLSADGVDQLATSGKPPRALVAPPAPERRWELEASTLQMSGEWDKLENLAKSWMAAQPSVANAQNYLGIAQQAMNRHAEAVVTLRHALDLDDHHRFSWLLYAKSLKTLGHTAEAEKALARAEEVSPSYADPGAIRADWLREEGRLAEARQQIKESLRRAPDRSYAWRILGLIEDARGDRIEAQRAFQTSLRLGDANADVRQRLAQLLADSGKADEASKVVAQGNLGKEETARTQIAIGLAELQRNRLVPAEEALRKAIALEPKLVDAWNGLGTVLASSGRPAEAEKAYDEALKLLPGRAETLINRATVRRTLGHLEGALEDIRNAITANAQYVLAWRLLGTIQRDAKNHGEAALAFRKIDGLGQANALDLVLLGESLAGSGDVPGGLNALARAEVMDPKSVTMCISMAQVLGNKGEIEKALTYLERALAIEPSNHFAWSSQGYALMKLGRLPEAVQALETAVALAPEFASGWINLGEAQLRSKNLGRAIQALEKAIALAPKAMDARLFLAQAYLGTRQPAKSREQAQRLLDTRPNFGPALVLLTTTYLMEGNVQAAKTPYLKLKTATPELARSFRAQAIASGVAAAKQLPE